MKKKYDLDDMFWALMIGLFLMLITIAFFVTYFPEGFSSYRVGFQTGANSTQMNITNAYYQGLLYTQQTGKLVFAEKDFTGQIQLKEMTIEEVCKNG